MGKFIYMDTFNEVLQIAKRNPEGFTIYLKTLKPVISGYCIGHKETQNAFGNEGLKRVIEHAEKTTGIVGGWQGPDGNYYFDTVIVTNDRNEALKLKAEHEQIAVFHLDTGETIF